MRWTIAGRVMPIPEQWVSLGSPLYGTPCYSSDSLYYQSCQPAGLVNTSKFNYTDFLMDHTQRFSKKARWTRLSVLSVSQKKPYACNMEIQLSSPCLLREACTLVFKPLKHVLGRVSSSIAQTHWQVWIDFTALHTLTHTHHSPLQRSLFIEKIFQPFLSSNFRDISFTSNAAITILLTFKWTPKSRSFRASFEDYPMGLPEAMEHNDYVCRLWSQTARSKSWLNHLQTICFGTDLSICQ